MVNSWSLLYDELYGDDEMTFSEEDQFVGTASSVTDGPSTTVSLNDDSVEIYPGIKVAYTPSDIAFPSTGTIDLGSSCNTDLHIQATTQREMTAHYFKYHEDEILKDIESYVSNTYRGHYTGTKHEYRNVQTLDLMAARDVASGFCQANILKYGSRYGSKDGKNKTDLMKVIHYAMLLLHFDEHYGKPSMTSGNIDHNMP